MRSKRGSHRAHATTDINPNRSGNDCTDRGNNGSNRCTHANVNIRHHRNMRPNEGKGCRVLQLIHSLNFNGNTFNPHLDGLVIGICDNFHASIL